jgi:hypothetical protein
MNLAPSRMRSLAGPFDRLEHGRRPWHSWEHRQHTWRRRRRIIAVAVWVPAALISAPWIVNLAHNIADPDPDALVLRLILVASLSLATGGPLHLILRRHRN